MFTDLSCDVIINVYDISFMKIRKFPNKNNLGNLLNMSKMRHSYHYTKCKPYECIRKNINFGVFLVWGRDDYNQQYQNI